MKRATRVVMFALIALCLASGQALPNSNGMYQQLRHIGLSGETVAVSNLVLKRDAATFTFKSGSFYLLAPVGGKITGAVFVGDGELTIVPPTPMEVRSLSLLTKQPQMREHFANAVLRFTDNTAAELKAAAAKSGAAGGSPAPLLADSQDACRKKLHYNLDARILQDVLSTQPGGLFVAFVHGQNYNGKMLLFIDPHGAPTVKPEEIELRTYDENKAGIWTAFHYTREYASGAARGTQENATIDVQKQVLDTQFERSGRLSGKAAATIEARTDGLRAVPLNLFPTLRVRKVTDAQGQPLEFIQEDKDNDPDFWVLLPAPLAAGATVTIQTVYDGKDAVSNEGNGNYFPVARADWYPSGGMGDYAEYEMTFAVPKPLKMLATGALVKEYTEGGQNISVWKSETPMAVAGFNFGMFKSQQAKLEQLGYEVGSYANEQLPDWVRGVQLAAQGSMTTLNSISTASMMKQPLAEGQVALGVYTTYFGPMSYKHLNLTQQTACNFGQSWPALVYLPICSFFDNTIKHQLGLTDLRGYWRVAAPHEVAHQWWGHTVGWNSYRDQWMSEGFAEFSASLVVQSVWKHDEFAHFWKDERELITEKNPEGFRAVDVGPVTLGYRLNNSRAGFNIARHLIYPKGAFILHMLRMMMWDQRAGDQAFREMMTDFVKTYANRAASTEDFKAMVEKHITPGMNVDGNGKMDWFFNEYVYGTALPTYTSTYSITPGASGATLKFKITQSDVGESFSMLVPFYLELVDGRVVLAGRALLHGNTNVERELVLPPNIQAKRLILNYNYDVLAAE